MAESEKGASLPDILKDGYGYSPKKITRDASLSVEAKAIYSYLASFADDEGKAYPGIELMCHELNISEKRFHRHKKQLIDKGFIKIERERTDNGWSNNIYTLMGYSVTSHFVPLRNVPLQNVTLQNDPTIITSLNKTSINKKDNSQKSAKRTYDVDSIHYQLAEYLFEKMQGNNPEVRKPDFNKWANDMRLMMERDNRKEKQIRNMIDWSQSHEFWRGNILSAKKLRDKYDQMKVQALPQNKNNAAAPKNDSVKYDIKPSEFFSMEGLNDDN